MEPTATMFQFMGLTGGVKPSEATDGDKPPTNRRAHCVGR